MLPVDPIEILEDGIILVLEELLWIFPADRTSFQIESLVNILVGRKQIVHDNEVNFPTSRQFHTMETIEPRQESVRVLLDMIVVLFQDAKEELMLAVAYGLDDETIVAGEVEEGARLAGRAQL